MKALRDCKKAVEILEGKRDLERQVIKPSRNAFDIQSQTATGSDIYLNDMVFTSNYSQKRIRKRKIPPDSTDLTEPQFLSIKRGWNKRTKRLIEEGTC